MKKFCCQGAKKLWELTSPRANIPEVFVGTCSACGVKENYTYWVPESLWRRILPKSLWDKVVCANCFHQYAITKKSKEIKTPETSQEREVWFSTSMCIQDGVVSSIPFCCIGWYITVWRQWSTKKQNTYRKGIPKGVRYIPCPRCKFNEYFISASPDAASLRSHFEVAPWKRNKE